MSVESFDDFDESDNSSQGSDLKPFQFRDDTTKEGTLQWLEDNFEEKKRRAVSRFDYYRKYNKLYKNSRRRTNSKKPRHSVNFVYDKIEDRVAQMDRMGVSISTIPANQDEQSDINNAKACDALLLGKGEELDMQDIQNTADRVKFNFGHSFTFVLWDKTAGPLHPKYKKYKDAGVKIPVMKNGKKQKGKFIKDEIHIGDIDVHVKGPDRVFPEIGKKDWKSVNEIDVLDSINKWELAATYPNMKNEIEEMNTVKDYKISIRDDVYQDDNMIDVNVFYHKKTKWLPDGAIIVWIQGAILSWDSYYYDEDCLPCEPDTDIDIHDEFWGRPFIVNIEQMQNYYNNIQSTQAADNGIGGRPKWMLPKGSAKVSQLNNDFAIVEYVGPVAPKLETPRPTNPQSFEIQDRLESKIKLFARTSDLGKGEVPQGITATSAIRLLDEAHSKLVKPMEDKRKRRLVKTYKMMLRRMQQYYTKDEGRMIRLLGKNNEYLIKSFDNANFDSIYDVRIENTSSLSESKAGKISDIIDLNMSTQTDPIFRKEEIIQMLDLGLDREFVDGATVAVTAAATVVEELINGNKVPEPQKHDNFLVHYSVIDKTMQSFSFRSKVSEEIRDTFEMYMMVLEGMMFQRAKINAKFANELSQLSMYPVYFKMEEPLSAIIQRHMMPIQQDPLQGGADTTKTELSATKTKEKK